MVAPAGTWSIVRRLTLLYAAATFALLLLATGSLYWALARDLAEEDHQFLADEVNLLRKILKEHPEELESLRIEVEVEGAERLSGKYYARVLDEVGKVLMETEGMTQAVPAPTQFPTAATVAEPAQDGKKWRSPGQKSFLLTAAWAEFGVNQGRRLVQVALDVSREEATLMNYRRVLLIVLVLGVVCAAGMGTVIARRGMRPLEKITQAAEHITASQLHERINPAQWPQELTALATAFDRMLSRLEESFTRLSQFSADLAHELRTPINNLMGEVSVALARQRPPDEYREVLESNLEECGRLSRMIDNLLFLARADKAEPQVQKTSFDATKEIAAVVEFFDAMAAERGVSVTIAGSAVVPADVILFRRALSNLLSNALQYTPNGGRVTTQVRSDGEGHAVEVSVSDTGCGIAPEHLPKIFDRFYRVDRARSQPPGTGLGLAIVKSIMELHGGSVTAQSVVGKGTTFTLRFPAAGSNFQI